MQHSNRMSCVLGPSICSTICPWGWDPKSQGRSPRLSSYQPGSQFCHINWCVSTCIPSNKVVIIAQRVNMENNHLLIQKMDPTRQVLLRKTRLLWAVFLQSQFNLKELQQQRRYHVKQQYWWASRKRLDFNSLASGNTTFDSVKDRLLYYVFYSAFHLMFWETISCSIFSLSSPTLSLSTVFCDVLDAMEMVSGWLLPSPWLSASSTPSLQKK